MGTARFLPTSLTGRLVATLVAVVVLSTVLLALVTALVTRNNLNSQLDDQVSQTLERSEGRYLSDGPQGPPPGDGDHDERRVRFGLGDAAGTLSAQFDTVGRRGDVVTSSNVARRLSTAALDILETVPTDGESHVVDLPGVGSFRVRADASSQVRLVAGQSTRLSLIHI